MVDLKGFMDYTSDDLRDGLTEGYYLLEITEANGAEWDDGSPRIDFRTKVAEGAATGKFGPMHTITYGAAGGVTADGREWSVSEEESRVRLVKIVNAITDDSQLTLTNQNEFDRIMMDEIADQIKGRQFVALVGENDKGYDVIRRFNSVSKPPKKYQPTISAGSNFAV